MPPPPRGSDSQPLAAASLSRLEALPAEMLAEILRRLPVDERARAKLVSKRLSAVVRSPDSGVWWRVSFEGTRVRLRLRRCYAERSCGVSDATSRLPQMSTVVLPALLARLLALAGASLRVLDVTAPACRTHELREDDVLAALRAAAAAAAALEELWMPQCSGPHLSDADAHALCGLCPSLRRGFISVSVRDEGPEAATFDMPPGVHRFVSKHEERAARDAVPRALASHPECVVGLDIQYESLDDNCAAALAALLAPHRALRGLCIDAEDFGLPASFVRALAPLLDAASGPPLEEVVLKDVDADGCIAALAPLASSTALCMLRLQLVADFPPAAAPSLEALLRCDGCRLEDLSLTTNLRGESLDASPAVRAIAAALPHNRSLAAVQLEYVAVDAPAAAALGDALADGGGALRRVQLFEFFMDMAPFFRALPACGLKELRIDCQRDEEERVFEMSRELAAALADKRTSLWKLEFNAAKVDLQVLAPSLRANTSLREVDLSYSEGETVPSDEAVSALFDALAERNAPLLLLSLDAMHDISPAGAQAVVRALRAGALTAATELSLSDGSFGDDCMEAIAEAVAAHCKSLETLWLSGCSFGSRGAAALARMLAAPHPSLTHLSVEADAIGDDGARALADALLHNVTLRVLYVRGHRILGADAWAALEESARSRPSLQLWY